MVDFVAQRDITISASETSPTALHLVSEGLVKVGLPELELVDVPRAHAREGAVVINQIAQYTASNKRIAPGEMIGISAPHGSLIARLVASDTAPAKGLGRLLGGGSPTRLRIEEPVSGMAPLSTLLTTILLWRADAANEADDPGERIEALRAAIALFPGDPSRREAPSFGIPYNWENHLAYATLARCLDGDEAIDNWELAAARCARFETDELGDSSAALRGLQREALLERARDILTTNLRTHAEEEINEHVIATASPIWRPSHDDTGSSQAARTMNVVTRGQVYRGESVLRDAALLATAVDLVLAHRERPAALLALVDDTRNHWEGGADEAPLVDTGVAYRTGDRVLSLALAHVARFEAAAMTAIEMRALCGLEDNAEAAAMALRKQAALDTAEAEAQMAALSGG